MPGNHGSDAASTSSTDVDHMRSDFALATFAALDAVLNIEDSADSFATLFERFQTVFGHDDAMVLEERGDKFVHCIASVPQTLIDKRWAAGDLFGTIVGGRVLAADPIENFA